MKMSYIAMILLAVFLLLFGIFSITNIEITWGRGIEGWSALIAGIVLLIATLTGR